MDANQKVFEFDDIRVEPHEFRVVKAGEPVSLEPKAFGVLVHLLMNAGKLVLKDELLDLVWNESFVTPNVLTRAIAQIRRELGEVKGRRTYITTVPKRGYRFVGDLKGIRSKTTEQTLAVLPFKHLSPDESNGYLGIGLADSLITKLSNVRTLAVRPTAAVIRFDDAEDPVIAGSLLKVENVLTGTMQESRGILRVSVQLVRITDEKTLWGETFSSQSGDVFTMQDEISSRITQSLRLQLTNNEMERLLRRPTDNQDAQKLYMRGRFHLYSLSHDGLDRATRLFKSAVDLDENFALAHAGIAGAYLFVSQFGDDESARHAEREALRAVSLDCNLAEGHSVLAAVHFWIRFDAERAESSFQQALELDPQASETNHLYGWFLAATGRFEESMVHLARAAEADPVSAAVMVDQGLPLYFARRFSDARAAYEQALEFAPDNWYAHMRLGEALEAEGRLQEARVELERSLELTGGDKIVECLRARVCALTGGKRAALSLLREIGEPSTSSISPYFGALVQLALGDRDSATRFLEASKNRREKWFAWAGVDPRLSGLRTDQGPSPLL